MTCTDGTVKEPAHATPVVAALAFRPPLTGVGSSQAMPTETAKAAPPEMMETR